MTTRLANLDRGTLVAAHYYQHDGTHANPNECTISSMATLLALAATLSGESIELSPRSLARFLDRIPFRHPRFPAWFPGPGGATHPRAAQKGLEAMIRKLRRQGLHFPWWPQRRTRQSPDDLEAALAAGWPTLIYGVGAPKRIPHVVVPVERDGDGWLILDPGYPRDKQPMRWTEGQLVEWWGNYGWLYPAGTMVSMVIGDR
jgi:hypothetical protein